MLHSVVAAVQVELLACGVVLDQDHPMPVASLTQPHTCLRPAGTLQERC
jgi:hypothetical protein